MFKPRPRQVEILTYRSGKMGISAVPGSGKTATLSELAARIILSGDLDEDQEVLVVTLVNSAVDNFNARVGERLKQRGLLPHIGYRVRTLHGLAHDIVSERPGLVGLANNFEIIDERAADRILQDAAQAWLRGNPGVLDEYLKDDLTEFSLHKVLSKDLPDLVGSTANAFISMAKDMQVTPDMVNRQLEAMPFPLPLARMGAAIYSDYQRALNYRGAVDFDDLIRLALMALESDDRLLDRLRATWRYILEDEAQDSSRLQEMILRKLTGETGNWVRVGDPNQAIFETFTTANPRFLLDFIEREDVTRRELPNSGRCMQSIIDLANELIRWTQSEHPVPEARSALTTPYIEPTPPGDPQPNPPDHPEKVMLMLNQKYNPVNEIEAVVRSLKRYLTDNPQGIVAVLVPRNQRGFELVEALKKANVPHVDILRSSDDTRSAARVIGALVSYLADPKSPAQLAEVFQNWRGIEERKLLPEQAQRCLSLLRRCVHIEDYLWAQPGQDWLAELELLPEEEDLRGVLADFRALVRRWQAAALLPIDQLILTLAQDQFTSPTELAISHKLALLLRSVADKNPAWGLAELTRELTVISDNQRRFIGFSEDDSGFDPSKHPGEVVVATMHKAKGLEWDRVYLMSVNNYDFPSGQAGDSFISEKWFLRNDLNLEAEAVSQLQFLFSKDEYAWYEECSPTEEARRKYVEERLRLLYVGITRARQELVITWNTGRKGDALPALPLVALYNYWEKRSHAGPA